MRWIAFGFCFILLVIIPVWVIDIVEIGFILRVMFTLAGAAGIYIALEFGTVGKSHSVMGR